MFSLFHIVFTLLLITFKQSWADEVHINTTWDHVTDGQWHVLKKYPVQDGLVNVYTSSLSGLRHEFSQVPLTFQEEERFSPIDQLQITINVNKTYQTIRGFGGAMTDAAAININSLPLNMQNKIFTDYLTDNGLEYRIIRVPISGSDFSTHPYTYDDNENDFELKNFSLAKEDIEFKIPMLKKCYSFRKDIHLLASSWSSPAWMKTGHSIKGRGSLIGKPGQKYYKIWANYIVKFLDAYASHDLPIWAMTTQNEPSDGFLPWFPFNALGMSFSQIRDWIRFDLGPALHKSGYTKDKLKLFIIDDQRFRLYFGAKTILSNPETAKYVHGIAFHWYLPLFKTELVLDLLHKMYPDMELLSTEACSGAVPFRKHVYFGSWTRAEDYAKDILKVLNHWGSGWIDWNMALDMNGGPNWAENFVDSPIIVNAEKQMYIRQPMFYALAHFSKHLPFNSTRIDLSTCCHPAWEQFLFDIKPIAVLTPLNEIAMVILNNQNTTFNTHVSVGERQFEIQILPKSLNTYVWKND